MPFANDRVAATSVRAMERPLNEWQRGVLSRLASVEQPAAALVQESLPHVAVTEVCGCACPSFNVRDLRFPQQPHELEHHANGLTTDENFGFALWTGPDGRPVSVDLFDNRPEGSPPDWPHPDSLLVEAANAP